MKKFKNSIFKILLVSVATLLLSFSFGLFSPAREMEFSYAESEKQTETTEFLQDLVGLNESLSISYMQMNDYVLDAENQLSTDFCWLFASLKCLESSYMIQKDEYYNFSETGMAYLNYITNISSGQTTFNTTGNLLKFNNLASSSGLIFENDVSNDLLLQINESNYKNYSNISSFASKNLIENVKVVSFGENPYFASELSYNQQILAMKKFIKNYGALFIAFGDGDGVIFKTTGLPQYDYSSLEHTNEDYVLMNRHSVCLIGWNSTGFIALNSWGDESGDYQTFCIPYATGESKLDELISTVRGFVIEDSSDVSLELGSTNSQKNVFNYYDDVALTYAFKQSYDINEIAVQVFKGTEDVTSNFELLFDDVKNKIKIIEKFTDSSHYFGGYVIRFFKNGKVIANSSFVILSGSEIAGVSLFRKLAVNSYIEENLAANSSFLTGNNTTTYLLDPYDEYKIRISLSDFSKCKFDENDPEYSRFKNGATDVLFEVSSIKMHSIILDASVWSETNLLVKKSTIDYDTNTYEFVLPAFSGSNEKYKNKLLSFDITVNSTTNNEAQTKLTFMIFVGDKDGDNTNQNLSINYQLSGGKNDEKNIVNFPNYKNNSSAAEFVLQSPTKNGFEFLGWFSDSGFSNQVQRISSSMLSDLVLYAKWDSAEASDYILTSLEMSAIKDFYDESKNLTDEIIYGDTVTFLYKFLPQSELVKYSYDARLVAYFVKGGEKVYVDDINNMSINKQSQILFKIGYPDIEYGEYNLIVETYLSINNVKTIKVSAKLEFSAIKRKIDLNFENLNFIYDGNSHFPTVKANEGDVFEGDLEDFRLIYSISSQKDAGKYDFSISSANFNYLISDSSSECSFEILKKKIDIIWGENSLVYNANAQTPKYSLDGIVKNDVVSVKLKNLSFIDVGDYKAEIDTNSISNKNYYIEDSSFKFSIAPAKVKITFEDITEKLKVAPNNRKEVEFEVSGNIFSGASNERRQQIVELMNIKINCKGLESNVFGKFDITATCESKNFDAEIISAVYNLIAPYKVVYTLPDGTIYTEQVEENGQPKGVNREIYDYTIFQVPEYSRDLYGDGTENLYITVTIKDYTIFVIATAVVALLVAIYLIMTRKQHRNKVS